MSKPVQKKKIDVEKKKKEEVVLMCAEKDLGKKVIQRVINLKGKDKVDQKKTKKMRAAFLKSKIWSPNTTINVGFMNTFDPEKIPRTSLEELKRKVDRNGVALKLDPIQEEVDDMPIISAIIYTVCKRFNDIVHPEHKPDSVTIDPAYVPKPMLNVKFNFFDPKDRNKLFNPNLADIRIEFDRTGGAWSYLGTDILTSEKTECTMNFGWFDVPTTLHEFCHALAMVHEHSNPNGKPINWSVCRITNWANASQGWNAETIKENIVEKYKVDQINGSEFDPLSIMLYFYPGNVICKDNPDGSVQDITLGDVQKCFGDECSEKEQACRLDADSDRPCQRPGKGTSQNLRFSPFDVLYLNKIYMPEDQLDTAETFTVNFFQDFFSEQIKPEELTRQLKLTKEREKQSEKYEDDESYENYTDEQAEEDVKMAQKILKIESFKLMDKLSDTDVQVSLAYIILCIILICLILFGNFKKDDKKVKGVIAILLAAIIYFAIYPNIEIIKAIFQ